jgi:hypothetical protein
MSDEKSRYMAELDQWTAKEVIYPLYLAAQATGEQPWAEASAQVGYAIRAKVYQSYQNGKAARP